MAESSLLGTARSLNARAKHGKKQKAFMPDRLKTGMEKTLLIKNDRSGKSSS